MNSHFIYTFIKVSGLIALILSLIFCVLTLFVLVYYIRKRYKLYQEINRLPQELLVVKSYKNHLKNLKIRSIISNLIIVILVMEFLRSSSRIFIFFPSVILNLVDPPGFNYRSILKFENDSGLLIFPICYSFVPVLLMLMNFLWLAYRKYEYKYTLIRWTWYIEIRGLIFLLVAYSTRSMIFIPLDYQTIYGDLSNIFFLIFDFIQFVNYARKFYLHLKSREKEIRLFYYDNKAYLDMKYLRIHFKVAIILVGTALFFTTILNCYNFIQYI